MGGEREDVHGRWGCVYVGVARALLLVVACKAFQGMAHCWENGGSGIEYREDALIPISHVGSIFCKGHSDQSGERVA